MGFGVDFTAFATTGQTVQNITQVTLDTSSSGGGNNVELNLHSIFDMTPDISGNHTLYVAAINGAARSFVGIAPDTGSGVVTDLHLTSGVWGFDQTLTYTGTFNDGVSNHAVTLNVQEFANVGDSLSDAGSVIAMDSAHQLTPTYYSPTTFTGTTASDFVIGTSGGPQTLDGGGGQDILIGNSSGGNTLIVESANFTFLDGGHELTAGGNTLQLGAPGPLSATPFNIDFTTMPMNVRNIDFINLWTTSANTGNSVKLNIQDVFDMTNTADSHTLSISDIAANRCFKRRYRDCCRRYHQQ